jgi:hypothetical protein
MRWRTRPDATCRRRGWPTKRSCGVARPANPGELQLGCRPGVDVKSSLIVSEVARSALLLKAEWPLRSGGLMGFEFSDR